MRAAEKEPFYENQIRDLKARAEKAERERDHVLKVHPDPAEAEVYDECYRLRFEGRYAERLVAQEAKAHAD